jgi:hypothetical protein
VNELPIINTLSGFPERTAPFSFADEATFAASCAIAKPAVMQTPAKTATLLINVIFIFFYSLWQFPVLYNKKNPLRRFRHRTATRTGIRIKKSPDIEKL